MKKIPIIGEVFNYLTVLEELPKRNNQIYYLCICQCGKKIETCGSKVRNGYTKSCGCYRPAQVYPSRIPNAGAAFNRLFYSYQWNAKKNNREFKLTEDKCKKLFKDNCFYCGSPPTSVFKSKSGKNRINTTGEYLYNGIDRIDNNIGYINSNVVSCCNYCNLTKRDLSLQEFMNIIKKIYEFNKLNEK